MLGLSVRHELLLVITHRNTLFTNLSQVSVNQEREILSQCASYKGETISDIRLTLREGTMPTI